MQFRTWFVAVILAAPLTFAQESLRPGVPVAIVGGKLLDGYEAPPIHHSVVVFENGRITAVGQKHDTEIPDNAVIIDAGGRTVMPGLIDAHMHIDLIGHGSYEDYYELIGDMDNLGRFMQRLNTSYALYFRYKHRAPGHVLQGRYRAKLVEEDDYMVPLSRYIHLNPVRSAARRSSKRQRLKLLAECRDSS